MLGLSILQYNCGNSNHRKARHWFDAASPAEHQILAIQEPYFNRFTRTTYCPSGFALLYEPQETTRTCFMVSKQLNPSHWSVTHYGPNVSALRLAVHSAELTLINVYNPRDERPQIQTWPTILQAIQDSTKEVLLLGDFNTHHPAWGGVRTACEPQADLLWRNTQAHGLNLLTTRGEATWKRGIQESVIDLTFASQVLSDRVIRCGPVPQWATTCDHIPIRIELDLTIYPPAPPKRFALHKLDTAGFLKAVRASTWAAAEQPLEALQTNLREALEQYCPKAKSGGLARPEWTPRAAELLAGARQARRRYQATAHPHDHHALQQLSRQLTRELIKGRRSLWRRFLEECTTDPKDTIRKNLWRISRWSKRSPGLAQGDPHLPRLRRGPDDIPTQDNAAKATILAERFFPQTGDADLSDISGTPTERRLPLSSAITALELEDVVLKLPNRKSPGPDGIPNEILKIVVPHIREDLAQAISNCLAAGAIPARLKDSITVTLRKEAKPDYSLPGSYRPIALENTLAKVIEKVVADRISAAAEAHALLPWNQMGARRGRSTISAISLLTSCVQTAWKAKPGCVVSMLSLDIQGAFDNVAHKRLLWILDRKGYPEWVVQTVHSFLTDRRTRITFSGYESEWVRTQTGIPQGSPLSPILFLFFISELLEDIQRVDGDTFGFGFVDDTSLITWGDSARDNCQRLTQAHDKCIAWAKRHGARFAPEKYQLIHFTRGRRHSREDLASTVQIDGYPAAVQDTSLRVLGVWVDPKLQWKEHIKHATRKGDTAFTALSRITASTWGPSMRRSRLLYTAIVRPAMLYGAPVWGIQGDGLPARGTTIRPLQDTQNKCLRRITGGYKRTPRAALEREAGVAPLDIQIDHTALQHAARARTLQVHTETQELLEQVWTSAQGPHQQSKGRARPQTAAELLQERALERVYEIQGYLEYKAEQASLRGGSRRGRRRRPTPLKKKESTLIKQWAELEWRRRWLRAAHGKRASTWHTPWATPVAQLYHGLTKAEATALFLLRTEIIGLNGWLASVGVPEVLPRCTCGWPVQTVQHILLHCPSYNRTSLTRAGDETAVTMLSEPRRAQAAARWFIAQGILPQFRVAQEVDSEDLRAQVPIPSLQEWL